MVLKEDIVRRFFIEKEIEAELGFDIGLHVYLIVQYSALHHKGGQKLRLFEICCAPYEIIVQFITHYLLSMPLRTLSQVDFHHFIIQLFRQTETFIVKLGSKDLYKGLNLAQIFPIWRYPLIYGFYYQFKGTFVELFLPEQLIYLIFGPVISRTFVLWVQLVANRSDEDLLE